MGFIGGAPAYWFLRQFYPGARNGLMPAHDSFKARGVSKLATYFGGGIFAELADKVVIDFGCGLGDNALELAARGCRHVIGLDIQEDHLAQARAKASALGLDQRTQFLTRYDGQADAILSTDAFEHFADPAAILRIMHGLLKPSGFLLAEFGPTWYHPAGGHLFSVFPWSHLVFTEKALLRWRSDFKTDGATRFGEVAGGLNQMTIARFERLVGESDFAFESYELRPIRAARRLHNSLTREWLTSVIIARLRPKV
jgi:SAM-dependent methyltransferase